MTERKPQNQEKFIVRLPEGMRERIKNLADKNHRSMNAEVVAALEQWLIPTEPMDETYLNQDRPPRYGAPASRDEVEQQINEILREQAQRLRWSLLSIYDESSSEK